MALRSTEPEIQRIAKKIQETAGAKFSNLLKSLLGMLAAN